MEKTTIIQTIVVLAIVAAALVYVLRRIIKTTRGKSDCGCGKNCNHKKPKEFYNKDDINANSGRHAQHGH